MTKRPVVRRALSALAAGALASVLASGCKSGGADPGAIVSSTGVIDVLPSTGAWDPEYGRGRNSADCSFRFRVFRRIDGIGVQVEVFDDKAVCDDCRPGAVSCPVWDDDSVECFFDGDNDRSPDARSGPVYYGGAYALAANGAASSDFSSRPGGFGRDWSGRVQARPFESGRACIDYELRFSWKCLGFPRDPSPCDDVTFGFNICVHDDDDGGRGDKALYWKGGGAMPYCDESRFGTITLKGLPPGKKKR